LFFCTLTERQYVIHNISRSALVNEFKMDVPSSSISACNLLWDTILWKGLTNISDDAHKFFIILDQKIRKLETTANLNLYGSNFSKFLHTELNNDNLIFESWTNLFYKFKLAVVSNFLIFWSSIMKNLCASSEIFVSPFRMFCFLSVSYKDSLSLECSNKKLSDFCISYNASISVFKLSSCFV
jgi:hypothetical protein